MSSQLKTLLGVKAPSGKPAGSGTAAGSFKWAATPAETAAAEANALSLKAIMEQEVAVKQQAAVDGGQSRIKNQSWAAKASSSGLQYGNSGAGGPVAAGPRTAPAAGPAAFVPVPSPSTTEPNIAVSSNKGKAQSQQSQGQAQVQGKQKGTTFGGKEMSPEMADWCAAQLRRITGNPTADITLMQFCMSLNSGVEIREYLAEYLGSSVQVPNLMQAHAPQIIIF